MLESTEAFQYRYWAMVSDPNVAQASKIWDKLGVGMDSCVTSGQLRGVDLGPEGPYHVRIVHGTRRCSIRTVQSNLSFPRHQSRSRASENA